jgi:hypothetical protein
MQAGEVEYQCSRTKLELVLFDSEAFSSPLSLQHIPTQLSRLAGLALSQLSSSSPLPSRVSTD